MPQQAPAIHKLAWHDWAELPHDTGLHELIDGEHVVVESLSAAGDDRLRSPLLPGLEIALADLFAAPPWQTD